MLPLTDISITIISDNYAQPPFISEHGFSVFIKTPQTTLLFDAGAGPNLFHNAEQSNIDLNSIDLLVLSHGHDDHSGAIADLITRNQNISVYYHSSALVDRYSFKDEQPPRKISVTEKNKNILQSLPENQNNQITDMTQISNDIYLTGSIQRSHSLEDSGGNFYFDTEMKKKDPVNDEISLWIESDKGIIIITGCCHAGLINTCEQVKKQSGKKIYMVLGGFHLHSASQERLLATTNYINQSPIQKLVLSHCSGQNAINFFKQQTSIKIVQGFAGYNFSI